MVLKEAMDETIKFNEAQGRHSFVINEETHTLTVYPSRSNQKVENSSKVKLTSVVDYSWDAQNGVGRLTAIHYSRKYIAYCVKLGLNGAVRILDLETQQRALMRANKGLIRDVEFMHKKEEVILGFIDEYGTSYVYRVQQDPTLETTLLLQVELEGPTHALDCRRFIWCRYVPDGISDSADTEVPVTRNSPAYQFAIIEDDLVYVTNLRSVIDNYGEGVHNFSTLMGTYLVIREHTQAVVDASFAPDGTAIATASRDGTVKFFQIYLLSESGGDPRCLYSWSPHDGEPVSRIFFLDDHTLENNDSESQYWKFVITAGSNMSELKMWNCVKWECIQILRFSSPDPSSLRMGIDVTANFFVLSDAQRKALYLLHIEHDDNSARWKWIAEFSIPVSILGFNVSRAEFYNKREINTRGLENFFSDDLSDADACVVDLMFVQPKSLMGATIAFLPPVEPYQNDNGVRTESRISFDDTVSYKDGEGRDSGEESEEKSDVVVTEKSCLPFSSQHSPASALSPDSFTKRQETSSTPVSSGQNASLHQLKATPASVSHLTQQLSSLIGVGVRQNSPSCSNPFMSTMTMRNDNSMLPIRVRTSSTNGNLSNASSSPSREVEEILSPKNNDSLVHKPEVSGFQTVEAEVKGLVTTESHNIQLDAEGNLIDLQDKPTKTPPFKLAAKSKSLGGGELGLSPSQIPDVLEQVNSIMDMMKAQAQELKELRTEVNRLNGVQLVGSGKSLDESVLNRVLDKYTSNIEARLRRTEEAVNATVLETRGVPKGFTENVTLDLAHAIKTEIESTVLPQLLKIFEPVGLHLSSEISSMIKSGESKLQQHIRQILNSNDFKSALTEQTAGAVKSVCDGVMSDVFSTSVCPNFEKSLQALFDSVNQTFFKGTKEYMTGVEASVRISSNNNDEIQASLKRQFSEMTDTLSSILQVEVECQLRQFSASIRESLLSQLDENISRKLSKAFAEQQRFLEATLMPRTATPALTPSDLQGTIGLSHTPVEPAVRLAQLSALVDSGDITGAFTKVASLADHEILMSLAMKVSPSLVFTRDLPTVSHVSIIQQMAADITTYTETKIMYLQTAVGTLNLTDQKVLRSLSRIVPVFQNSVSKFAALNPESPFLGTLKFLEMAFLGIGNRSQQQQQVLNPGSSTPRPH